MGRLADSPSREGIGGSALRALLAISRELAVLEGRKTLLLFSEGLHVPSGLTDIFETLVSEANRSNLRPRSGGLRAEGSFEEAKMALLTARNLSQQAQRTRDPATAASQEARTDPELDQSVATTEVQMHDIAEDSLRLNTQANLLHFDYDRPNRKHPAHFSVLVLVRDGNGQVVTRLSHDWPIVGPLMDAPDVRNQSAAVKRALELVPGTYTLETAVGDRLSGGLSVPRTALEVAVIEPIVSR